MMKPKHRGIYTVDWPNAKEERAYYDGEHWYRFMEKASPDRVTHDWEGGTPRKMDWREFAIEPGWYEVEGYDGAKFWDGKKWFSVEPAMQIFRPVRAASFPGGEPG